FAGSRRRLIIVLGRPCCGGRREARVTSYVLAIDQGTTSTRASLFRADTSVAAFAQQEFPQYFPADGEVEHEPEDIWATTVACCRGAMQKAGATAKDIVAIGITNQRETTLLWDRVTGRAVHRAIVCWRGSACRKRFCLKCWIAPPRSARPIPNCSAAPFRSTALRATSRRRS